MKFRCRRHIKCQLIQIQTHSAEMFQHQLSAQPKLKQAGSRLYTHSEIDHEGLFALMASVRGSVMLTYDDAPEVRLMAERHGFRVEPVPMKNTHHELIRELLILKP